MTGSRCLRIALAASIVMLGALPARAADIMCQFMPYGNNPLGVFVKAHALMDVSVPIHVVYYVRENGRLVTHAMQVRLTRVADAMTWTLIEPTATFTAALASGTLAQDKGCTATAPISDAPPQL